MKNMENEAKIQVSFKLTTICSFKSLFSDSKTTGHYVVLAYNELYALYLFSMERIYKSFHTRKNQNRPKNLEVVLLRGYIGLFFFSGRFEFLNTTARECKLKMPSLGITRQNIWCWTVTKWAATWQNQQSDCAPSEDSDQPGHPPSLIRVFAVRWMVS